ncbi:MAG: hypothetical protein AAGF71_00945 [Pseudomonadota bacterium]
MHVLIVGSDAALGGVWQRHLERSGKTVTLVTSQDEAVSHLSDHSYSILILDMKLDGGDSALAVADYAGFRRPDMRVVCVTRDTFFSDGSLFQHVGNACAMVRPDTPPDDVDAVVEHFAMR